ncbi:MAG: hypothetical protein ACRDH8_05140 [Actinomycetota bacterium]
MQSRSTRSTVLRAVGVLAALLLAAGAISPAFGAKGLTKKKVKRIARKQAINQINALVPGLITAQVPGIVTTVGDQEFVSQDNYVIFKETLSFGQERTLATNGPLTLLARCRQAGGNDIAEVIVRSTASEWWTTFDNEYTAPGDAQMHHATYPTGTEHYNTASEEPAAIALSGGQLFYIGLDDYKMGFGLNILGNNCIVTGSAVLA